MYPDEIPQQVDPVPGTPCIDGKRLRHSAMPYGSMSESEVLDDDDILIEILVRVGFPTTLVHAALVCRRWFHHASDPVFLRRFRKLHPPRLLGFYHTPSALLNPPPFVPMVPQPPELATVVRRVAMYQFGAYDAMRIRNCQNGSIFTIVYNTGAHIYVRVHSPLCPGREMAFIPRPPYQVGNLFAHENQVLSKEDDDGCLSHFYVSMKFDRVTTVFTVHLYKLQDGAWCKQTLVTTKLTRHPRWELKAVLINNKIYVVADPRDIIVLDLMDSTFSTIQLPQGVEHGSSDIVLSRANDASCVYLIETNELQLNIWLYKGGSWLVLDTIFLRMLDHTLEDKHSAHVKMCLVGENAEFVFLIIGECTFYLDIKGRALRKVHERRAGNGSWVNFHPFMMIWPPTFPTLKDDPARNAT